MKDGGARDETAGGESASFGVRLRDLRREAGLTQEELASRAGLSPNAIGALERGARRHPYPHTVRALADALGLGDDGRNALLASVPRRGTDRAEPAREAASEPAPGRPSFAVRLPRS